MGFIEQYQAGLNAFTRISRETGARADYVQGGGGNTSVKLDGAHMAIKASGFRLSDIAPDKAYAVLNWAELRKFYEEHEPEEFEDTEKAGADAAKALTLHPEGLETLRPSVEAGFHSLLDHYAVHTHSVYANLVCCAAEGRDIAAKALDGAGYSWGFVPYTDPGARLTFAIRDEIRRVQAETGKRPAVLLLQNHGLIAHADSADEALRLHTDANARLAGAFGLRGDEFPEIKLRQTGDDSYESATPFVVQCLKSGKYGEAFFLESPLYPDQLVFLAGTFSLGGGSPETGHCTANTETGAIHYAMAEAKARTIEETVAAVLFIAEHLGRAGYTLQSMGDAAKNFIANWEGEKYRKSVAGLK